MWSKIRVARCATLAALLAAYAMGCGDDTGGNNANPIMTGGTGAGVGAGTNAGTGAGTMAGGTGGGGGTQAPMMDGGVASCGGSSCASGQMCVNGQCRTPCTGDASCGAQACCEGFCTDTDSDSAHCGACGMACASGLACASGECAMPMCSGEPGAVVPVDPDADAGVDDDAPVYGDNGCPPNESCVQGSGGPSCMCGDNPGCPGDQHCQDGACKCGDNPGCATDEACCDGSCVDLSTDKANCGECGFACAEGYSCGGGQCACPDSDEELCDGECVDVQTDEANCGKCGNACADGATCVAGECQCDEDGEIACNGVCIDGESNSNCGECGNACEAPSTCRDPSGSRPLGCYCPNVNEVPCNGACVALGTTQNCGACGDTCSAPTGVCRQGSCECPTAGQTACGDTCYDLQVGVDIDDDPDDVEFDNCGQCGLTCLPGAACNAGVCSCPSASTTDLYCDEDPITGATDDAYMCIEVTTTKNCGACGNACLDESECRESGGGNSPDDFACVCVGDDSGKTHCPAIGCRDLDEDAANCGECGHACPENVSCDSGECDCPGGSNIQACTVDGEPTCVDTNVDDDNCGECGNSCGQGEDCCGGNCVDIDSYDDDRDNCGACGTQCADFGCGFLGFGSCNCNNGTCEG